MSYSEFTLTSVKREFNLTTIEEVGIFEKTSELKSSNLLKETLAYNLPIALASNSEKARSELLIAPILTDLRRQLNNKINLFSGIEFNVDNERGLNGVCDFIISRSPEILEITAPVIIVVEAKKENLNSGLGQCIAEMVAAQIFNQNHNFSFQTIFGAVTIGTIWRFLKLEQNIVSIDLGEYYLQNVEKVLGILASGVGEWTDT
jgi:hypothetical protein